MSLGMNLVMACVIENNCHGLTVETNNSTQRLSMTSSYVFSTIFHYLLPVLSFRHGLNNYAVGSRTSPYFPTKYMNSRNWDTNEGLA